MELIVSDTLEGLQAAVARAVGGMAEDPGASRPQRLDARSGRQVSRGCAALRHDLLQVDAAAARRTWRGVRHRFRPPLAKALAATMDNVEREMMAYMCVSAQHRTTLHPAGPLTRVNNEAERRTDAAGILLLKTSVLRRVGAVLLGIDLERF